MNKEDNTKVQKYISEYIKVVNEYMNFDYPEVSMAGEILKSKIGNLCNKEIVFDKTSILDRLENYEPITEDEWEYVHDLMLKRKLTKNEREIIMNSRDMITIENGKPVTIKGHFIKEDNIWNKIHIKKEG